MDEWGKLFVMLRTSGLSVEEIRQAMQAAVKEKAKKCLEEQRESEWNARQMSLFEVG